MFARPFKAFRASLLHRCPRPFKAFRASLLHRFLSSSTQIYDSQSGKFFRSDNYVCIHGKCRFKDEIDIVTDALSSLELPTDWVLSNLSGGSLETLVFPTRRCVTDNRVLFKSIDGIHTLPLYVNIAPHQNFERIVALFDRVRASEMPGTRGIVIDYVVNNEIMLSTDSWEYNAALVAAKAAQLNVRVNVYSDMQDTYLMQDVIASLADHGVKSIVLCRKQPNSKLAAIAPSPDLDMLQATIEGAFGLDVDGDPISTRLGLRVMYQGHSIEDDAILALQLGVKNLFVEDIRHFDTVDLAIRQYSVLGPGPYVRHEHTSGRLASYTRLK
jgi:hypothetical protein